MALLLWIGIGLFFDGNFFGRWQFFERDDYLEHSVLHAGLYFIGVGCLRQTDPAVEATAAFADHVLLIFVLFLFVPFGADNQRVIIDAYVYVFFIKIR